MTESTYNDPIFGQIIKDKQPTESPRLIIAYGPPGSGKGYVIDMAKKELGVDEKNTIEANVDFIISQMPEYQKEISKCAIYFSSNADDSVETRNEFIKNCNKTYDMYRGKGDEINDKLIDYATKNKLNIIFETTGNSIKWTIPSLIKPLKEAGYQICLVFPITNASIIAKRLIQRAAKEGRVLNPESVIKMVPTIHSNFVEIIKYIDVALVYNNNNEPKLIFTMNDKTSKCMMTDEDIKELSENAFINTIDMMKNKCSQSGGSGPMVPLAKSLGADINSGSYQKYIKYKSKYLNLVKLTNSRKQ